MTLFVDASAIVGILADEPDHDALAATIDAETTLIWSPMTCWEAVSALQKIYQFDVVRARTEVERFALDVRVHPVRWAQDAV